MCGACKGTGTQVIDDSGDPYVCFACHGDRTMAVTLPPSTVEAIVKDAVRPLRAAMAEAIAILDSGTDYERLHVSGILAAALSTPAAA